MNFIPALWFKDSHMQQPESRKQICLHPTQLVILSPHENTHPLSKPQAGVNTGTDKRSTVEWFELGTNLLYKLFAKMGTPSGHWHLLIWGGLMRFRAKGFGFMFA